MVMLLGILTNNDVKQTIVAQIIAKKLGYWWSGQQSTLDIKSYYRVGMWEDMKLTFAIGKLTSASPKAEFSIDLNQYKEQIEQVWPAIREYVRETYGQELPE